MQFEEILGTILGTLFMPAFFGGMIGGAVWNGFLIGFSVGFYLGAAVLIIMGVWGAVEWYRERRKFRAKAREAKGRRELYYGKGA